MAFREVQVHEIKEVLRVWLRGESLRSVERLAALDRKTVRRYVAAAQACGLDRDGGEVQLTDELIAKLCEAVRPSRSDGHGSAWGTLTAHDDEIKAHLDGGLTVRKTHELLARRGVVVPERTLHRYALEVLGHGRSARSTTVRVADGEPGVECQVDFGRMGLIFDPESNRRRVVQALIFTACYSRHCFVYLSFSQTTEAVIAGCEAAWAFFSGIFKVLVPDNMSSVIDDADPLDPRFNRAFVEYAQERGFLIDPARVRRPTDKPRVERSVPFVRGSFFAGESFVDLADAQRRVESWCKVRAGMRVHGTTQCHPAELFALEEAPHLLPVPVLPYLLPHYAHPKVHRDHHIEVQKAIYSVPTHLIGRRVDVRVDQQLVKVSYKGEIVKVHPKTHPGGRVTDPGDLPAGKATYALRDLEHLQRQASLAGPSIGAYASAILEHPLPWTKMRQVYALLGLVKKWGPSRVELACSRALEAEAVSVALIGRMLERGTEDGVELAKPASFPGTPGRFARPAGHFKTTASPVSDTDGGER
jgi:hypothetical protein